ncbi:MAG: potassium transporter TrkG [Pirellulales bacterium]
MAAYKQLLRITGAAGMARLACLVVGLAALVAMVGFPRHATWGLGELDHLFLGLAVVLSILPLADRSARFFMQLNDWWRPLLPSVVVGVTVAGYILLALVDDRFIADNFGLADRTAAVSLWSKLTVLIWLGLELLELFRRISFSGWHPATVLLLSFLAAVLIGAALLTLPVARAGPGRADFSTALFTSTSAICVTGLIVVDTGTYWSREGQIVILALIQIGGLGIMTFGAFFSLLVGRGLLIREAVLMGDIMERRMVTEVRSLVLVVLGFTVTCESVGAMLISGLWADLPSRERLFQSVFHSVSAFCNAGFALAPDSFERYAYKWQVWGALAGLIVAGGLGFVVIENGMRWLIDQPIRMVRRMLDRRQRRPYRLSLTTRLVWITTLVLLVAGTALILWIENDRLFSGRSWPQKLSLAWFQSVTCRTAGFNTLPIAQLTEVALFLSIILMFIGASPGSTGGGVKTTSVAVATLTLRAILRSRPRVEVFRRTIPELLVYRALLVVALSTGFVVTLTLILLAIESHSGRFLDYLFEVTSAFATVGLSTGVTPELTEGGRAVIVIAMFAGRVGPLTLFMALAGASAAERYRYPEESVVLG